MKKIAFLLLLIFLFFSLLSCEKTPSAEAMIYDFISAYSAKGTIYSSGKREGEDGYVYDELLKKIYIFEGAFPKNYAIFLNSHTDFGAECAAFVCEDEDERAKVINMSRERITILGKGKDNAFLSTSGSIVFYSTLSNRAEAEALWRKILSHHT